MWGLFAEALITGIPKNGYTNLIYNMLDGIDVEVGIDFIKQKDKLMRLAKHIVYTGPIDEFFDFEFIIVKCIIGTPIYAGKIYLPVV